MATEIPRHKVFISYFHKDDEEYKGAAGPSVGQQVR